LYLLQSLVDSSIHCYHHWSPVQSSRRS